MKIMYNNIRAISCDIKMETLGSMYSFFLSMCYDIGVSYKK